MRCLLALLLFLPGAADAADRRMFVAPFERIRVEGAFQVTVATNRPTNAAVSGDQRQIDATEVRVDGTTLVIRPASSDRPEGASGARGPVTVTVGTPRLIAATVLGGGALTVAGTGRAARLDLTVSGPGTIGWTGAAVDLAQATVVGSGQITVAGQTATARLAVNGSGRIDAAALAANELTVTVEGPGEVGAAARYMATVSNNGLGKVTVTGSPKCLVRSVAGGSVRCGTGS